MARAARSKAQLAVPAWVSIAPLAGLWIVTTPVARRTPLTDAIVCPAQETVTQGSRKASSATVLAMRPRRVSAAVSATARAGAAGAAAAAGARAAASTGVSPTPAPQEEQKRSAGPTGSPHLVQYALAMPS